MPGFLVSYVRWVDYFSTRFGRLAMYTIFLMIGVLLLGAVTRNILNIPLSWTVEMAQFLMAGYYIVGGAYSMQLNDHVRMDLIYDNCSDRGKARIDSFTNFFLIFYLVCLLVGSISSTIYAIEILMLLQGISTWLKDIARWRGLDMPGIDLVVKRGADSVDQRQPKPGISAGQRQSSDNGGAS